MHVKICGLTRPEDALHAENAGADAIGLNFVPGTKRFINLEQAKLVLSVLGPFMARVGVFQNASLETVLETVRLEGRSALMAWADLVPPPWLEQGTPRSTIWCSNQLS